MTESIQITCYGDEIDVDLSAVERLRKLHKIERVVKLYETERLRELHGNKPTEDAKEVDDGESLGRTDGIEWAAKKAKPSQLRRLDKLETRSDAENVSWTSYAWFNFRDDEFLAQTILDLDGCRDTRSFDLFWKQFGREYSIVRSFDYLDGFLCGAINTWRVIQEHPAWSDDESN